MFEIFTCVKGIVSEISTHDQRFNLTNYLCRHWTGEHRYRYHCGTFNPTKGAHFKGTEFGYYS